MVNMICGKKAHLIQFLYSYHYSSKDIKSSKSLLTIRYIQNCKYETAKIYETRTRIVVAVDGVEEKSAEIFLSNNHQIFS